MGNVYNKIIFMKFPNFLQFLGFLQKNLISMVLLSIFLGIAFGNFVDARFLQVLIFPLTFLMIFPQMVNLKVSTVLKKPNTRLKIVSIILNFIVLPFFAFFLVKIFFPESPLDALGLMLIALLPTGSMTIAYTGMTKGNLPAAIRISVFSLILAAFVTPIYLYFFMGAVVDINFLLVIEKILLIIFLPLSLGIITRYFVTKKIGEENYKEQFGKKIGVFSVVGVLGMVFSVMAMKAQFIVGNIEHALYNLLPIFLFYFFAFGVSSILGKMFFEKKDALALVFGTSLRHLAIALAVAVTAFGEDGLHIALIISIAFVFQVKMGAVYAKISDKIF